MKRYFITLILSALFMLLFVAGCSQNEESPLSSDSALEAVETITPDVNKSEEELGYTHNSNESAENFNVDEVEVITPPETEKLDELGDSPLPPDSSFAAVETIAPDASKNEEKLGYIHHLNESTGDFDFDEVEWITSFDTERIEELEAQGIDIKDDMPNGFYIYNPSADRQNYQVNDATEYAIIDWHTVQQKTVSFEDFLGSYHSYSEAPPYQIVIDNGMVIHIGEAYIP